MAQTRRPGSFWRGHSPDVDTPRLGPERRPGLRTSGRQVWQKLRRVSGRIARDSPARATLIVFLVLILVFTGLLMLPFSTSSGRPPPFIDALFTAVSAVCVTGLTTVETAEFWSHFGQGVIMAGVFIGGLGVMTLASMLALVVSSHLGLSQRVLASTSTGSGGMSGLGRLLRTVLLVSIVIEGFIFIAITVQMLIRGVAAPQALWDGLFMAVSGFNNAGFLNIPGGANQFIGSWGFLLPIIVGATIGALGFPVIVELIRSPRRPRRWTLHTKLTLTVFGILFLTSVMSTALLEWNNPATLGPLSISDKILNSLLSGSNTRSLGISAVETAAQEAPTIFLSSIFMFIGGGSASTAGGIKVTTFAVLFLAVRAEARGHHDVEVFQRRMSFGTVRLAVSVLFVASLLVGGGAFALLLLTDYSAEAILFEAISAFGTVGLSLGITPFLPPVGKAVLALLMFAGRLGPITFATALALRDRRRLVRMPESRPIVG